MHESTPKNSVRENVSLLTCIVLTGLAASMAGARPNTLPSPPEPPSGARLLDILSFDSQEAARSAWSTPRTGADGAAQVAGGAVAPVEALRVGGRPVLKFSCNFRGTTFPRGCWDRTVKLDLRRATAVLFDVYVQNTAALGNCNVYLKSGDGWYAASWFPEAEGQWCRIRLPKSEFAVDTAAVSGWATIAAIRFSPWAMRREDTALYVANFAVEEPESPILLLRQDFPDTPAGRDHRRLAMRHSQTMSELLAQAGILAPTVGITDLDSRLLAETRVLLLPYVSDLPEAVTQKIAGFVRAGGKLLACFTIPDELAQLLGVGERRWRAGRWQGEFASMRFGPEVLPDVPRVIKQNSGGLCMTEPLPGSGRVVAWWHSDNGARTDAPAIVLSANGVYFSHVLLIDDARNKAAMLKGLLTLWYPQIRRQACERQLAQLGSALGPFTWEGAVRYIESLPVGGPRVQTALQQATALRRDALGAQAAGDFTAAFVIAEKAEQALVEAYSRAQRPQVPEFRGTWCHSPDGIPGQPWTRTAAMLADAGIDHLFLNASRAASASYPSEILPYHVKYSAERPDRLAEAIDACARHRIRVHVWMTNYQPGSVGTHISAPALRRFRDSGRLQIDDQGHPVDSLCPSHVLNLKLQADAMVEAALRPGVAGIHFDYIRYPSPSTCFCPGCRAAFERRIGKRVGKWPQDALAGGPLREPWIQFRCDTITRLVKIVHARVRTVAPDCMISAAVFQNYPQCRDGVGQDWRHWVEQGWLDFVCPMNYTGSHALFANLVRHQLTLTGGRVPLYPGIGLQERLGPVGAIRQIQLTREHNTGGFMVWSVTPNHLDHVYPYLGLGMLAR